MNKWKLAFFCCLTILLIVSILSVYSIIDQAYTLTYHKVGYKDTENDLEQLVEIINKTDLKKKQIETVFNNQGEFEFMDFNKDTISLNRILLIFENDNLIRIEKEW